MNLCINRFWLCCAFLLSISACTDELSEAERFQKICRAGGECDTLDGTNDSVLDANLVFDTEFDAEPSEVDSAEVQPDSDVPEVAEEVETEEDVDISDTSDGSDVVEDTTDVVIGVDIDGSDQKVDTEDVFGETEEDATELAEAGTDVEANDAISDAELSEIDSAEPQPDSDVPDSEEVAEEVETEEDVDISDTSDGNDVTEDSTDTGADAFQTDGSETNSDALDTADAVDTVLPPKCLSNEACEDGNSCTDNTCIPATGCTFLANTATCTDNNACTENDLCKESVCVAGKPPVCDDGNPCTIDYCDPTAACKHVNTPAKCTDNNACTENDACQDSICTGTPKNCDDGNSCTEDTCSGGSCSSKTVSKGYNCGQNALCKESVCTAVQVPVGMVLIPGGDVWIGCNKAVDADCQADEEPYTKVFVDAYLIDKTEVLHGKYMECQKDKGTCQLPPLKYGCSFYEGIPTWPVNCVSLGQAETYCKWSGQRLPTEVEWQKAARGGCDQYSGKDCKQESYKYPWGNQTPICDLANFGACGDWVKDVPTKLKGMSPYGVEAMAGNVSEWTSSWYDTYTGMPTLNPNGPAQGTTKVVMGGSYSSPPADLRVSRRINQGPGDWKQQIGFRCAKSITF